MALLKESSYFKASGGHDHTLIVSTNQNMNYFFMAKPCLEMLQLCWNCTKLSIDEYLFIAKDREFEMKNRGINWHAVPFPSDYHYDSRVYGHRPHLSDPGSSHPQPPWEWKGRGKENRSHLISFLGNPRKFSAVSTSIREALVRQCMNHSDVCRHGLYDHEAHDSPNYESRRCECVAFYDAPSPHSLVSFVQLCFVCSLQATCPRASPCSTWFCPAAFPCSFIL